MGVFTSNLTVDEHHAIRSVGFSPVGQVMGSCVYNMAEATVVGIALTQFDFCYGTASPSPMIMRLR